MRVDIWSDVACPWCWIGLTRFERVLGEFAHADGVEVRLHSYQLDPGLPESYDGTEAEYLAHRKGADVGTITQMFGRVGEAAASEGLTMNFDTVRVANTRRAHRLLHAAQDADPGGAMARALEHKLFEAHFSDGESVWDADVLVRLARESGLDENTAREALDSPEREAQVAADIAQAAEYGATGVPFFVLADTYGISGAQPAEVFEAALEQVWAEQHPQQTTLRPITVPGESGEACGPEGCD